MNTARFKTINSLNIIISRAEHEIFSTTGLRMKLLAIGDDENIQADQYAEEMLSVIANALGYLYADMKKKSRHKEYLHMRYLGAFFLKQYYPFMTLEEIGYLIGLGDHTSVLHALTQAKNLIDTSNEMFTPKYQKVLEAITQWTKE